MKMEADHLRGGSRGLSRADSDGGGNTVLISIEERAVRAAEFVCGDGFCLDPESTSQLMHRQRQTAQDTNVPTQIGAAHIPSSATEEEAHQLPFVHRLANLYMVETFSHGHFDCLIPQSWVESMNAAPISTLKQIVFGHYDESWPGDLKRFIQQASRIALTRTAEETEAHLPAIQEHRVDLLPKQTPPKTSSCRESDKEARPQKSSPPLLFGRDCTELTANLVPLHIESVVRTGMKPKKLHEVGLLAALIQRVSEFVELDTVIDFGSGKGYLGQVLTVAGGLRVIGVDSQEQLNTAAFRRSEVIVKWARKRAKKQAAVAPVTSQHATSLPSPDPESSAERINPVRTVTAIVRNGEDINDVAIDSDAVLTGLHTCGDLHTSLLRFFCESNAQALVSVGCCYHRRTDEDAPIEVFPLSNRLDQYRKKLSRRAMELACHARETWAHHDEGHFYGSTNRAMLEKLFVDQLQFHNPGAVKIGRMKLKKGQRPTDGGSFAHFSSFACEVVRRLQHKKETQQQQQEGAVEQELLCLPDWENLRADHETLTQIYDGCIGNHHAVVGLYALRTLLGTVIETLLLCDRVLYLREHVRVATATVFPLFDPAISPRNFVIVAEKRGAS